MTKPTTTATTPQRGEGSIYFDKSKGVYRGAVVIEGRRHRVSGATPEEAAEKLRAFRADATNPPAPSVPVFAAPPTRRRAVRGEGSIYFDQSKGLYRGALAVDGRRHRVSGATRPEVAAKLRDLRVAAPVPTPAADETVGQFLAWWLDTRKAKVGTAKGDLSINTYELDRWAVEIITEALGDIRLADLEAHHVDRMLKQLAAAGRSRSTVVRVRTKLGQALAVAQARGRVTRNAGQLAAMPYTAPPKEKRALTVAQAAQLLDAVEGHDLEAVVVTGMMLGLRPGELLGLRWADVDFKAGTLSVRGSLKVEPGALRLGSTKTPRSVRTLQMPERVASALKAQLARQRELQIAAGPLWANDEGLVFTTAHGTPFQKTNMTKYVARITEGLGLGTWSLTELGRHTSASLQSAQGVPLEVIADGFGHTTTRMVDGHYRHQVTRTVGAPASVIEDLFAPRATTD